MATIGLRDLFIARCTEEADGAETYGTPKRLAKAMTAELSVEIAEGILYGDDAADTIEKEFVKGTLKLGTTNLENTSEAELLGQTQDADGVTFAGEGDDPPYWAVGFRAKKPGGFFKYIWLYKTKFKIPDEKYETKGDGIAFQTPEIEGEFIKRNSDGRWKANHTCKPSDPIAQAWFNEVREPKDGNTQPVPRPEVTPLSVVSAAGSASGKTALTVSPAPGAGNTYKYKTGATVAVPAVGASIGAGWTAWDGSAEITATTGDEIVVVEVDASNLCVNAGKATVTAKA